MKIRGNPVSWQGKDYPNQKAVAEAAGVCGAAISRHLDRHGNLDRLKGKSTNPGCIDKMEMESPTVFLPPLNPPDHITGSMAANQWQFETQDRTAERDKWVIARSAEGHTASEIGRALGISSRSVKRITIASK